MIWMFAIGLAMAAGDPCDDATKANEAAAELAALVQTGKDERAATADKLDKNDAARVKSALKMKDSGLLCKPEDKLHAAFLIQWSMDSETLEIGHNLAKEAMMARVHTAPWLTALTYDRWQVSRGLEQRYASQMVSNKKGVCLYPVKADSTDQERMAYDMPPVTDAYRRVLDANGFTDEPPTYETVYSKELFCDLKAW
ncbi:MAG: hypothetical protein GWP91_16235 [Rhodobacterales bacterium]|nr:hypothetical protein [Rhodobacterales bacterium]